MELTNLTISAAAELLQRGEISPLDLTRAHLERIERFEPILNAFITITAEQALEQARRAEQEITSGTYRGSLHGIPIALKDLYDTSDALTTGGATIFADRRPAEDAFAVQLLRKAGAVFLGKLNMHEIALGVTNVNPHYGPCCNPWDTSRVSGGSSGGSAAALAAHLCMGALGSDTGGSIRIPASLCGVVGLKPSYGLVSLRGVIPLSWNLDHPGSMARTVRDAALLLGEIASYDPQDPVSIPGQQADYQAELDGGVRGWKIALARGEFIDAAESFVLEAVEKAASVFAGLGATVIEPTDLPDLYTYARANGILVTSDAAAVHDVQLREDPSVFGEDVRRRLESGRERSAVKYAIARRIQAISRYEADRFFQKYDLLLLPATPIPAPPIAGTDAVQQAGRLTRFTAPFNIAGVPAVSVPCGFSAEGLPLGLQIVAGRRQEARLLRGAHAYEQAAGWIEYAPVLA